MSGENTALMQVAARLSVSEEEVKSIVMNTIMPGGRATVEQFTSFIAVANEYGLNPLTKEIYAFPAKGGIQPIVSIDGWLRIINSHHDFNGMTFEDNMDESGALISITCTIYKKNTDHPIQVTEYMEECKRSTEPWNKWPARMLRHKAAIQGGRYAFGLSGIIDPDEAGRFEETGAIDTIIAEDGTMPIEQFNKQFPKWEDLVAGKRKTVSEVFEAAEKKGFTFNEDQTAAINKLKELEA